MKFIRNTLVLLTLFFAAAGLRAETWQYAMFSELSGEFNYSWQDGDRHISANRFDEFAEKLANAGVIASGAKPKTLIALLDLFGQKGWELVTVHNQDQGRAPPAVMRYFKRPSQR